MIRCTSSTSASSPANNDYATYTFSQTDCSTNIEMASVAPTENDINVDYVSSPVTKSIQSSWTYYFKTKANCPLPTKCELKASNCNSAYAGTNAIVAPNTPWGFSVKQTVSAGWTEDICMKCTAEPSAQT